MSQKKIKTRKINQKKKVNLEGYYHYKSGKYVGPYDREAKQYPDHYITQRIDPKTGQLRWVEITKIPARGGVHASISMKYLDQKPRGIPEVPISFEQARKAFENQPLKSRVIDLQHRAKKTYPADQITSRYLKDTGRKDVEGIDTPPKKPSLDVDVRPSLGIRTSYKIDLMKIEGGISHVDKGIAPNQDKGIYLYKIVDDINEMIKKYERAKKQAEFDHNREKTREIGDMINNLTQIKANLNWIPKDKPIKEDPSVYFDKAQDILKGAQRENDKKLQTKKSPLSKQKTSDAISKERNWIAVKYLGRSDAITPEERLKDSQELLSFLRDNKDAMNNEILQEAYEKERPNQLKLIRKVDEKKTPEQLKNEIVALKEEYARPKTQERVLEIREEIALKEKLIEDQVTNLESLEKKETMGEALERLKKERKPIDEEKQKEALKEVEMEALKNLTEGPEEEIKEQRSRKEEIILEIKAKNSELSKEEIEQLSDQIELKERKNKKMVLFLCKKIQSESDGSKIKIETLKNEITKKTKITPEEFDVLIKELKKDKEIEQQGTDVVLKKEQKPSKTEVIKPELKKEEQIKKKESKLPELKAGEKYYVVQITKGGYAKYISNTTKPEKATDDFLEFEKLTKGSNDKIEIVVGKDIEQVRDKIEARGKKDYVITGDTYKNRQEIHSIAHVKFDYASKAYRGKLSPEEIEKIKKLPGLEVEETKEFSEKEQKESQIKRIEGKSNKYLKHKKVEGSVWQKDAPFTKAQNDSFYNSTWIFSQTKDPENVLNIRFKEHTKSKEDEIKNRLKIEKIEDAPEDVQNAYDKYRKEAYNYYLVQMRAYEVAPSTVITGSSGYKGNIKKANNMRERAQEKLNNANNTVDKIININKTIERKEKEFVKEPTEKVVDFGTKNKNINQKINEFKKEYKDVEIKQHLSGKRKGGDYKWYTITNKKTNKTYTVSIDENGNLSVGAGHTPMGSSYHCKTSSETYKQFEAVLQVANKDIVTKEIESKEPSKEYSAFLSQTEYIKEVKNKKEDRTKQIQAENEIVKQIQESKGTTSTINGHVVKTVDLRPIGSKDAKMCMRCGLTGLDKLKKKKCFDVEEPSEKYPYKNPNNPNNPKKCIYCGDVLSSRNVYMWKSRKDIVDKCERCTDKLESGQEMRPY